MFSTLNLSWMDLLLILLILFIIFPSWLYICSKMASMGWFEGLFQSLKNKGESEHAEKTQVNER